ncbi:hypothetical protein Sjap_025125 [Stephania japonica]|uniref:EF-hand domain-containing protein n=1 Tax=Stephania japonica TaxID=461633 RepID=A0AAP0E906_9MAGN
MSVEVLDGATIRGFVEDRRAFQRLVRERFEELDTDHDGLLCYAEMVKELEKLRVFETHFGVDVKSDHDEISGVYKLMFKQFDHNANGSVDFEEFEAETKNMMLAMANGLGFLPVQMVLEQDSFLMRAVEGESMTFKVAAA